jgi:hypothetical protein
VPKGILGIPGAARDKVTHLCNRFGGARVGSDGGVS